MAHPHTTAPSRSPRLERIPFERAGTLPTHTQAAARTTFKLFQSGVLPRLQPAPGEAVQSYLERTLQAVLPARSELWAGLIESYPSDKGNLTLVLAPSEAPRVIEAGLWWAALEGEGSGFAVTVLQTLQRSLLSAAFSAPEAWEHFETFTWYGEDEEHALEEYLYELNLRKMVPPEQFESLLEDYRTSLLSYQEVALELPASLSRKGGYVCASPQPAALRSQCGPLFAPGPVLQHTLALLELCERLEQLRPLLEYRGHRDNSPCSFPLLLILNSEHSYLLQEAFAEHCDHLPDDSIDTLDIPLEDPKLVLEFLAALRCEHQIMQVLCAHLAQDPHQFRENLMTDKTTHSSTRDSTSKDGQAKDSQVNLPSPEQAHLDLERDIGALHQISLLELETWWKAQTTPPKKSDRFASSQVCQGVSRLGREDGPGLVYAPTLTVLG